MKVYKIAYVNGGTEVFEVSESKIESGFLMLHVKDIWVYYNVDQVAFLTVEDPRDD